MKHALAFLVMVALSCGAHAVEVYRWTDSKGVVHYGDHPASGVAATMVDVPAGGPTPEEIASARASLEADRQRLGRPDDSSHATPSSRKQSARKPGESTCAAAWRQYDAAQACFDAHRVARGRGVTLSGEAACKEMPQPGCTR